MKNNETPKSYSWVELAALAEVIEPDEKRKLKPAPTQGTPYDFLNQPSTILDHRHLLTIFSAFASPLRLDIIELLLPGPAHAKDIAHTLEEAPNTLSRHLHILEKAGIVTVEYQGRAKLYSLKEGIERYLN